MSIAVNNLTDVDVDGDHFQSLSSSFAKFPDRGKEFDEALAVWDESRNKSMGDNIDAKVTAAADAITALKAAHAAALKQEQDASAAALKAETDGRDKAVAEAGGVKDKEIEELKAAHAADLEQARVALNAVNEALTAATKKAADIEAVWPEAQAEVAAMRKRDLQSEIDAKQREIDSINAKGLSDEAVATDATELKP